MVCGVEGGLAMKKSKLEGLCARIDGMLKAVEELDRLSDKISEEWGNTPAMALVEEAVKEECVYAEKGRVGVTGLDHGIGWSFEEIARFWKKVYEEEGAEELKRMAGEYRRLAEMLEK